MYLEKLIEMMYENPINICIRYSNINGEEQLTVNGEELIKDYQKYQLNQEAKNDFTLCKIQSFKKKLDELPDGLFNKMLDTVKENIDLQEVDDLFNQSEFTDKDIYCVEAHIKYISKTIKDIVQSKIEKLSDILDKFNE